MLIGAVILAVIAGCSKSEEGVELKNEGEESVLYVNVAPSNGDAAGIVEGGGFGGTKASGGGHGTTADDNSVQTLEIFVFNNGGGADNGVLESYQKFSGSSLSSLSSLKVKAKTGAKKIYAVANSHKENWAGITSLSQFSATVSSLKSENLKTFAMTGSTDALLSASTSVTIPVSRLVARVVLSNVKSAFSGTPYSGMTLSNVKVYMTNVSGSVLYATGATSSSPVLLNSRQMIAADCSGCAMSNMLNDDIAGTVGDAGHSTAHYFYCYENAVASETTSERYTRLVIQADLNGRTYYYPVDVNRDGYGWQSGAKGIKRNTSYAISVVISGPGASDPEEKITAGTITLSITVSDWATVPAVTVNF